MRYIHIFQFIPSKSSLVRVCVIPAYRPYKSLENAATGNYIELFLVFAKKGMGNPSRPVPFLPPSILPFPLDSHQFRPSFPHSAPFRLLTSRHLTLAEHDAFLPLYFARVCSPLFSIGACHAIEQVNFARWSAPRIPFKRVISE